MDAKDILIEAAIDGGSDNDTSKFSEIGSALPSSNSKNYQDTSTLPLAKVDLPTSRPCAVIGPDRILLRPSKADVHSIKPPFESWITTENVYRNPPEYSHKIPTYQCPSRNISPRQTFQENMQRIMVPPTYNSIKSDDNVNIVLDRNTSLNKDIKLTGSIESKYYNVPYSINPMNDNIKTGEMCVSDTNNTKNISPGWHPGSVNVRQNRTYGAHSLYEAPGYANCTNSKPVHVSRPQDMLNEDSNHLYAEPYYQHANIRFRPYPNVKERYQQSRYDYLNNYSHRYNPGPPFPPPKYDIQKQIPTHPTYSHLPLKYIESRLNESIIDGYQRPPQINYNVSYQNQIIHPTYGSVANGLQNKLYSYTPDSSTKLMPPNKLPYNNNKFYYEHDNIQNKHSVPENFYFNDMIRPHLKNQVIIPSYPTVNMQPVPQYIRKENFSSKYYDYAPLPPHVRHVEPSVNTNSHIARLTSQFSPSIAVSPSDSNTSNDTLHVQNSSFDECGYVSQFTNASMRTIDSNFNRIIPHDYHRYNYQFPSMFRIPPVMSKMQLNPDLDVNSKDKKSIDIRQFLQMWNEGDEENTGNNKEIKKDPNKVSNQIDLKNQEQLYILGSVNVPNEELAKYDHIQKVSKLPDNIKGCNNVDLLKQFEKVVESSHLNSFSNNNVPSTSFVEPFTSSTQCRTDLTPRSESPLDVEAKISQSVIHKDVGCNFELRLCSPEMLNVEVATPVQNLLGERTIEKVTNPYQVSDSSSAPNTGFNSSDIQGVNKVDENKIASCNLINTQCNDTMKNNYTLQDLEFNSSVCLASLPRLDNDIELNFPEVNQQFINANKESDITKSDLTSKENKFNKSLVPKETDVTLKTNQSNEHQEKIFAKLSKYRKSKKCDIESTGLPSKSLSKPIRTDSVIIKNPENAKSIDEAETLLSNNIVFENETTTSNSSFPNNSLNCNNTNGKFDETSAEIALDFSFNKLDDDSTENKELKITEYIDNANSINVLQNISTKEDHKNNLKKLENNNLPSVLYKVDKNSLSEKTLHESTSHDSVLTDDTTNKHANLPSQNENRYCDISTEGDHENTTQESIHNDDIKNKHSNVCFQNKNMIYDIPTEGDHESTAQDSVCNNDVMNKHSDIYFRNKNDSCDISTEGKCGDPSFSTLSSDTSLTEKLIENSISMFIREEQVTVCENNNLKAISPLQNNIVNRMSNLSDLDETKNNVNYTKHDTEVKSHISSKKSIESSTKVLRKENISQDSINKLVNTCTNKFCDKAIENYITFPADTSVIDNFNENNKNNRTIDQIGQLIENKDPDCTIQDTEEYSGPTSITINDIDNITSNIVNNSVSLSKENLTQRIVPDASKKCNIRKELFSPWIQKLIWGYEDTTCYIKPTLHKNQDPIDNKTSDSNSKLTECPAINENEIRTNDANNELVSTQQILTDKSEATRRENVDSTNCYNKMSPARSVLSKQFEITVNNNNILNETESLIGNEKLLIEPTLQETMCVKLPEVYQNSNVIIHKIICERRLKRSISDSALCLVNSKIPGNLESESVTVSKKRKIGGHCNINDTHHNILDAITNDAHINRRNSIASPYNDEHLSFCIVIDNNCILNEETEEDMSFPSNKINTVEVNANIDSYIGSEQSPQYFNTEYMEPFVLEISDSKSFEKSWVDDIGCVETVVSDNTDELITTALSPIGDLENRDNDIYETITDHRDKVKNIYGNEMCNHDAELLDTLYRTPQMNVNKTLIDKDSRNECIAVKISDTDENETNSIDCCKSVNSACSNHYNSSCIEDKDTNIFEQTRGTTDIKAQYEIVNSCKSSTNTVIKYDEKKLSSYCKPNSPEVSSTTSEEKNSTILLKITNHRGTRTSQLNNCENIRKNSCKFTENSSYVNDHNSANPRPLITKAAQKYIPPLRESLNFKVKLPLPQHRLLKLKQLKKLKSDLNHCNNFKREIIVKPKPKFEDVLKSIDEIQFKLHKEKNKKQKRPVPKLVIKKNENGSHYTSSSDKQYFNPDMTGRKWQPWVFIEKNNFIDKMAIKRKTKAIFSYRKNTFIFADKFQKYKSVTNAKFIISQPKTKDSPVGQLKYTIKLKHNYQKDSSG